MLTNIIAIPYRNREKHLNYFIKNTVPLVEKYLPNSKVVVVEQNEGKLFNRGLVLNIAANEYKDKTKYLITHDVDINPTRLCLEKYYAKNLPDNEVLGILNAPGGQDAPIIKYSIENFFKINGFPNNFWGWGGEDQALRTRREFYGIKKKSVFKNTNKSLKNKYFNCFNDIDDRQIQNGWKNHCLYKQTFPKLSTDKKINMILSSGLNNLDYKIIERKELHPIVELIKVEI